MDVGKELGEQCMQCPNGCLVSLLVSDQGIVEKAVRKELARGPARARVCPNLEKLEGKGLERALELLHLPRLSRVVLSGH